MTCGFLCLKVLVLVLVFWVNDGWTVAVER
jgi:hypothetical protein